MAVLSETRALIDARMKDNTRALRALDIYSYDVIRDPYFENKTLVCFLIAAPFGDLCHWFNSVVDFELLIEQVDFKTQENYMIAYAGGTLINMSCMPALDSEPLQIKIGFKVTERIPACYVCHIGQVLHTNRRIWLTDETMLCSVHEGQQNAKSI